MNITNGTSGYSRFGSRILTLVASLLALAACSGGGGGGGGNGGGGGIISPPPPPVRTPQTVVFVALDPASQRRHLFTASDEGSALTQLTPAFANANGDVWSISVSPDRQTVAYAADADTDGLIDLYVIPVSGGTPAKVSSGFPVNTFIQQITWAPDSSEVAYVANPQGRAPRGFRHNEVFLADRDGSNSRKINGSVGSPPVVAVQNIKWSPDSRYLAQTVYSLDPFFTVIGINTFDSDAGAPNSTRITPTLDWRNSERIDSGFQWSPDSSRIAYRSSNAVAGRIELYTVLPNGSSNTRVSAPLGSGRNVDAFSWSPAGNAIVYLADQLVDNRFDIFAIDIDGANNRRLNTGGNLNSGLFYSFEWSPDGSQIAFALDQDVAGQTEAYAVNVDGSGTQKLNPPLAAGEFAVDPHWSPDGRKVAYRSAQGGSSVAELYAVNADGTANINVSSSAMPGGNVAEAVWSPDGNFIAYIASNPSNSRDLFVSAADGTSGDRLNNELGPDEDVVFFSYRWSTDSSRVVFEDEFDDFFTSERLDLWAGTPDGAAPIMLNDINDFIGVYAY